MGLPYATSQELERETSKLEKQVEAVGENKQDKIIATPEDVGKLVGVDAEGKLTLVNAPSGGTKLYLHTCVSSFGYGVRFIAPFNTTTDHFDINSVIFTKFEKGGAYTIGIIQVVDIDFSGGPYVAFTFIVDGDYSNKHSLKYADCTDTVTEL